MGKRSTNFGGPKKWQRGLEMRSIVETMQALGMSDEEIKAKILDMQEKVKAKADKQPAQGREE